MRANPQKQEIKLQRTGAQTSYNGFKPYATWNWTPKNVISNSPELDLGILFIEKVFLFFLIVGYTLFVWKAAFFLNNYPQPFVRRSFVDKLEVLKGADLPWRNAREQQAQLAPVGRITWQNSIPVFSSCSRFQALVFSEPAKSCCLTLVWSTRNVLICWSASTVIITYWRRQTDQIAEGISKSHLSFFVIFW